MRKLKRHEAKVGMKVRYGDTVAHVGEIKSIGDRFRLLSVPHPNGGEWTCKVRSDGYWGANWARGYLYLVDEAKGGIMNRIKDLFKSDEQKLLEEYVYDGGHGLDWTSYIVQKVFVEVNKDALVAAAREQREKDKKAKEK